MNRLALIVIFLISACVIDETISGYVDNSIEFRLVELSGQRYDSFATIEFPSAGVIQGRTPCNTYTAEQRVPLPWFEISAIRSTRATCPNLSDEIEFFEALNAMTLIEPLGSVLILRNDQGGEMVFHALDE